MQLISPMLLSTYLKLIQNENDFTTILTDSAVLTLAQNGPKKTAPEVHLFEIPFVSRRGRDSDGLTKRHQLRQTWSFTSFPIWCWQKNDVKLDYLPKEGAKNWKIFENHQFETQKKWPALNFWALFQQFSSQLVMVNHGKHTMMAFFSRGHWGIKFQNGWNALMWGTKVIFWLKMERNFAVPLICQPQNLTRSICQPDFPFFSAPWQGRCP